MSWDDVEFLLKLHPGESIYATDKRTGQQWQGTIDVVAAENGQLWMFTELGERKRFDLDAHTFALPNPEHQLHGIDPKGAQYRRSYP
ncbi:hypothetical protein [Paenarthrobacter sp. NPDC057981]|uniref:hypothetical protein n=1 Tax=Paenarthrobacter sp. NPDC057981 TaxID=3346297 RepID=UPI0036D87AF3